MTLHRNSEMPPSQEFSFQLQWAYRAHLTSRNTVAKSRSRKNIDGWSPRQRRILASSASKNFARSLCWHRPISGHSTGCALNLARPDLTPTTEERGQPHREPRFEARLPRRRDRKRRSPQDKTRSEVAPQ